jgi:hypothetical protein
MIGDASNGPVRQGQAYDAARSAHGVVVSTEGITLLRTGCESIRIQPGVWSASAIKGTARRFRFQLNLWGIPERLEIEESAKALRENASNVLRTKFVSDSSYECTIMSMHL